MFFSPASFKNNSNNWQEFSRTIRSVFLPQRPQKTYSGKRHTAENYFVVAGSFPGFNHSHAALSFSTSTQHPTQTHTHIHKTMALAVEHSALWWYKMVRWCGFNWSIHAFLRRRRWSGAHVLLPVCSPHPANGSQLGVCRHCSATAPLVDRERGCVCVRWDSAVGQPHYFPCFFVRHFAPACFKPSFGTHPHTHQRSP